MRQKCHLLSSMYACTINVTMGLASVHMFVHITPLLNKSKSPTVVFKHGNVRL